MQDGFGNYCLQYVLELEQDDITGAILAKLKGHFPELSQQKFSSNMVEKCLKVKDSQREEAQETVIKEIVASSLLPRLLQVFLSTQCDLHETSKDPGRRVFYLV